MATWKEDIARIRELRTARKKSDAELYFVQIRNRQARSLLDRAKRKETISPENLAWIDAHRKSIVEREARLQRLAAALHELDGLARKLASGESRLRFLESQQRFTAAKTQQAKKRLLETQKRHAGDEKTIKEVAKLVDQLRNTASALEQEKRLAVESLYSLRKQEESAEGYKEEIVREREKVL